MYKHNTPYLIICHVDHWSRLISTSLLAYLVPAALYVLLVTGRIISHIRKVFQVLRYYRGQTIWQVPTDCLCEVLQGNSVNIDPLKKTWIKTRLPKFQEVVFIKIYVNIIMLWHVIPLPTLTNQINLSFLSFDFEHRYYFVWKNVLCFLFN